MTSIKVKQALYILGMAAGITLFIISGILLGYESKVVSGICAGLGAGLFSYSLSSFVNRWIEAKHPGAARKKKIEVNDERNITIKDKAGARTQMISLYVICLVAFIFTLLNAELYVMLSLGGLILLNAALYGVYVNYYSKRL